MGVPEVRFLLIDIDSQRPDHLGCYGYHRDTSPNIDRVAAGGTRFDRCYVSDSPCVPGRASLFGGMFGINNGVATHWGPGSQYRLSADIHREQSHGLTLTMARTFLSHGYYTASVSSFADRHHAFWHTSGFREYHHHTLKRGNETADEVNAAALPLLERICQGQDWLLHVNYWDPHRNYRVPDEWMNRFAGQPAPDWPDQATLDSQQDLSGPFTPPAINPYPDRTTGKVSDRPFSDRSHYEEWIDGYDGSIAYVDHHIGQLLEVLERQNVLDDTCIIITADHGEGQGEQGIYGDHCNGYEAPHHIPLIISLPGQAAGGVSDDFVYSLDIAPTLCQLAGIPAQDGWDGTSVAPLLGGQAGVDDYVSRDHLVLSHGLYACQRSVRNERWLLTRTYHPGLFDYPPLTLYDMLADPRQTRNMAKDQPEVVAQLDHQLVEWTHHHAGRPGHPGDPLAQVIETGPFKYIPLDYWLGFLDRQGRGEVGERITQRLANWPEWRES